MWHKKPTTKNVNQMDEEGKPDITSKDAFDSLIQIFSNVNALSPPPHVNVNHLSCVNFN
jgi:5'-AMP-activated protein kinase regulatory beta subunit